VVRSGTIAEVSNLYGADGEITEGVRHVRVTSREYGTFIFAVDEHTIFLQGDIDALDASAAGLEITGAYDASLPMILPYPPQYNVLFLAIGGETDIGRIFVGRFDEDLISHDNYLRLNLTGGNIADGTTAVIFADGTEFDPGEMDIADLAGRRLLVYYGAATRSIPALTTPTKVVVLFETAEHPLLMLTPEEIREFMMFYEDALLQVNGADIAGRAYVSEDNVLMIPVRAVAEAAGFEVTWFADTRSVQIGGRVSFRLGSDEYDFTGTGIISLGQAPVLRGSLTYVPVEMFTNLLFGAEAGFAAEFDEELGATVINIIFD